MSGGVGVGVGGLVGVCFDHEGQVQNCLYLAKTFVVKTLHYCNLLCYNEKCLTSLLTFKGVAMSLYHIILLGDNGLTMTSCQVTGNDNPMSITLSGDREHQLNDNDILSGDREQQPNDNDICSHAMFSLQYT